ncbi:hypothetical protein VE03_10593 [Pseudogymnoascus sp. 23342-1-I1]|nr:hypothetical protein VE03_10593 [Pseudogymnoascus sp. 23342-1-I1]
MFWLGIGIFVPLCPVPEIAQGLLEAERVLRPLPIMAWCCHHIKENFVALFGRGLAPEFWAIARAKTTPVYEGALEKLRSLKPEAATYLEAASPKNWVEVLFRGRRYGHDTSNIVES